MAEEVEAHVLRRYALGKKVGSGAYGHVWKVTDRRTGETVALKKIFDAFQHSTDAQRTYREITLLHEIEHPNVVRLHQVMRAENDKDLYLVFEYMEADLHNAISQRILKDAHNRFILYQLLRGLKFLHSAELIHRDLKPSNLLLNSDCTLKICDFGLARSLAADSMAFDAVLTEEVATRWYRAPEVLLGSRTYSKPADIWSVGCVLAEMLLGKPFFPGSSTLNQLERILQFTGKPSREDVDSLDAEGAATMIEQITLQRLRPPSEWFRPDTPPEAISLVVRMLQFNPARRPTAAELLRSPYVAAFFKAKHDVDSRKLIRPPVSDNTKLHLKDYRQLIYDHIRRVYQREQSAVVVSPSQEALRPQRPSTSHKPKESDLREETFSHKAEGHREVFSQKGEFNSQKAEGSIHKSESFSHKTDHSQKEAFSYSYCQQRSGQLKPRTSEGKSVHVMSTGKMNLSCHESEDERMRKKSSLRDLIKQKKAYVGSYQVLNKASQSANSRPRRLTREAEVFTKENKPVCSWDKR